MSTVIDKNPTQQSTNNASTSRILVVDDEIPGDANVSRTLPSSPSKKAGVPADLFEAQERKRAYASAFSAARPA